MNEESCNDGGRPAKEYEFEAQGDACPCVALDSGGGLVLSHGRTLFPY